MTQVENLQMDSYLIQYVWELRQFTEFNQVQPGHICNPSTRLWLDSFQVQRSSTFDKCHEFAVFHLRNAITSYEKTFAWPFPATLLNLRGS